MGNLSPAASATKDSVAKEDTKMDSLGQPERQTSLHTVQVQPLDDVTFKLNEKTDTKAILEKVWL